MAKSNHEVIKVCHLKDLRCSYCSIILFCRDTDESQVPQLDLHGLSVKDAIHVLSESIARREQGLPHVVLL